MADISPDNLFKALTGSFSPDANQRREAENIITAAQRQQGFMQALCRVWIEDKVLLWRSPFALLAVVVLVRSSRSYASQRPSK